MDEPFVAPRTRIEEILAALWTDILGIDRVGVHDHFFELGGDSLRATQIANRLHKAFLTQLSVRDFFERPTVASQAEYIVQVLGADSDAATLAAGE